MVRWFARTWPTKVQKVIIFCGAKSKNWLGFCRINYYLWPNGCICRWRNGSGHCTGRFKAPVSLSWIYSFSFSALTEDTTRYIHICVMKNNARSSTFIKTCWALKVMIICGILGWCNCYGPERSTSQSWSRWGIICWPFWIDIFFLVCILLKKYILYTYKV